MTLWISFIAFIKKFFGFITNPKNRSLIIFVLAIIFILVFLKQCNSVRQLKNDIKAKDEEIKRQSNNHLAELDTIKQSYDKKTGTLTATIKGYELTMNELEGNYSELFGDVKDLKKILKGSSSSSIIENKYYITENITNIKEETTSIDSLGRGTFSFLADTIFSPGNSRKISGKIPYHLDLYLKGDSSRLNYGAQNIFAKLIPENSSIDFSQEMTVYTGINRDKKTGEVTVWAKTNYPGVEFNVLKGANVKDDELTKKALKATRKPWGVGFSAGVGGVANLSTMRVYPGIFMGIGINYSPKKLQFGK